MDSVCPLTEKSVFLGNPSRKCTPQILFLLENGMIYRRSLSLGLMTALLASGGFVLSAKPGSGKEGASKARPATISLEAPVKVTTVEGITEYRLPNGLRVLLFPDPGKPTITVNITYLVGSRHENYGETGMAHLLEHLMFKGSKNHADFNLEATKMGAQNNASTWTDRTNYFETVPADEAHLSWALDMEADRMLNAFISQKDLWNPETQKGEMTVVRNEFESGENQPFRVLMQRVQSAAFQWHAYGKDTIGCRSDIENVNEARLQAFYHNYYQPDNAVLLVAGRFDEAQALKLIQEKFGHLAKPTRTLQPTYTAEPVQDGEHQVVVRRVGDVKLAMAGYHIPPGSASDYAAIEVMTQILADTPTGRLHKALVETKKATGSFGWANASKEPGFLLLGTMVPKEGNLDETKELFLKVLEETSSAPFTAAEVERAKTQLLTQVDLSLNDPTRVGLALSEFIAQGDWRLFFLDRDRVKATTLEDVTRVAKTYLKSSNRTLGLFIPTATPDRTIVQPTPDIAALVKDYKGQAAVSQGEAFDPDPSAIAKRVVYANYPSGLKLAVLPKKNRGESVTLNFRFHLGSEQSLSGKGLVGSLCGNMLMRGTSKHTRAQLSELFDKAKAQVGVYGSSEELIAEGETDREHLPEVIRLIGEILKEPSFPADEFEQLRQQRISGLEQARSEPTSFGRITFQQRISPYVKGHARYVASLEEQLEALKTVKLEDVATFHKTFAGASGASLSIVGDVDAKAVQTQIEALFGQWNSPTPYVYMPPVYKVPSGETLQFETPDKANAFFSAGILLPLKDTDPDYPAILIGNYLLGAAANNRLWTRIREKEGLSYGVGSNLDAGLLSRYAIWNASAILAPENAGRLEAAFREELDKALKSGFTAEELQAAKAGWLQERQLGRSQDRNLAFLLTWNQPLNRPLSYESDLETQVKGLTNQDVLAAMRKFIDPSKLLIVKAGDFAKASAKK